MSEADSATEGAPELEGAASTTLPRAFLVEASGPATARRESGDVVETYEAEISVSQRLETLEQFHKFWKLRDLVEWKSTAIVRLLDAGAGEDDVVYQIDDEQLEAWDVIADGSVPAYFGVAETMADFDGKVTVLGLCDRFEQRLYRACTRGIDETVHDFAHELQGSPLWGPGARLADLAVQHAKREDIEGYVEVLLEELQ